MTTLNQGLLITAIGMGLVFLMILALWGVMALLVKLTNKPEAKAEEPIIETVPITLNEKSVCDFNGALAAAIAVAYALESHATTFVFQPGSGKSSENAWLNAGRTQQLYSKTIRGRNR